VIPAVPEGLAVYERASSNGDGNGDGDGGGGDAPTIVLVHGTVDRGASFIRAQKRLAGRRVVRYDRRGYARSRSLDASRGLEAHVEDLLAVVGEGPAIVVGHSFGGLVALAAAAAEAARERRSIVAVGSFESPMAWADWWPFRGDFPDEVDRGALAEGFMRSIVGDDVWDELPERSKRDRRAEGDAVFAEVRSVRRGEAPLDFAAVQVPVVVGYGTSSPEHLQRAALDLIELLPHARLHAIEGAAHDAHVTHPAEFAELVVGAAKLPR
jgi:pimeloyl-ACP methyl ester carboxylesterase